MLGYFLYSCLSTSTEKSVNTKDYGVYNPSNVPEEYLCTIIIDQHILVNKFDDDEKVGWSITFTEKTVRIPSGVHTFYAFYADRQRMSTGVVPVIAQLEKGNTYLLKGNIANQRIQYQIVLYNDGQEGADVTLNINRLQGNDANTLSIYIKYVLNPTSDETGNSIKLENNNYILLFEPDMVYTLTDKITGRINKGRVGFSMDFSMTNGKVFLLETDIERMSKQQFLSSRYQENAQIILIPINCTENEVTYRYEKPAEQQGNEIIFSITEIRK
jgi:hypothetical protein